MATALCRSSKASSVSFAILSDLHLETPVTRPTYSEFALATTCPNLALLGDIGLVNDARLFSFLEEQLLRFVVVFYVLGNHEPYDSTLDTARDTFRALEDQASLRKTNDNRFGRFIFLDQVRYDFTPTITILGCALFSAIDLEQGVSVGHFVSDFERI